MLSGSSLCGSVRFIIGTTPEAPVACHCTQCRKQEQLEGHSPCDRGEPLRSRSQSGRGVPTQVGQSLPVVFDPQLPGPAGEATFRSLWMCPMPTSPAGLPPLLAGLMALR
jgi:hypothetical protein